LLVTINCLIASPSVAVANRQPVPRRLFAVPRRSRLHNNTGIGIVRGHHLALRTCFASPRPPSLIASGDCVGEVFNSITERNGGKKKPTSLLRRLRRCDPPAAARAASSRPKLSRSALMNSKAARLVRRNHSAITRAHESEHRTMIDMNGDLVFFLIFPAVFSNEYPRSISLPPTPRPVNAEGLSSSSFIRPDDSCGE